MRAALLATAALALALPAHAQQSNDQYQLRGATAVTTVDVGTAQDVGATAVASGNAVTASEEDDQESFNNLQHMDGDANAHVGANIDSATGNIAATSAAIGNGGTATLVNSEAEIDSTQLAHGDANASVNLTNGYAGNASSSASSSGNVAAVSAQESELRFLSTQESTGLISADVEANHDFVYDQAVSGAIASANNLTVGGETATILTDTHQNATGESVSARVDMNIGYATDVSGNATANANAVTIDNQWGYVNARVDQNATANVSADSTVTLTGDFLGFASSSAYGVGNQAIVSNVGSDAVLDVTQSNAGDISANASLNGEGGDSALASAAAYGNSVTGALCAFCDENVPSLTASNDQTNDGAVSAHANVTTSRARTVGATSTAIGNAATYQVSGPSN